MRDISNEEGPFQCINKYAKNELKRKWNILDLDTIFYLEKNNDYKILVTSIWHAQKYNILELKPWSKLKIYEMTIEWSNNLRNFINENIEKLKKIKEFKHMYYNENSEQTILYFSNSIIWVQFRLIQGIYYGWKEFEKFLKFYSQASRILSNEVKSLTKKLRILPDINKETKEAFDNPNANAVHLNVFPENIRAKKFYEKIGFKERRTDENAFSFKDEAWGRCNMVI